MTARSLYIRNEEELHDIRLGLEVLVELQKRDGFPQLRTFDLLERVQKMCARVARSATDGDKLSS